MTMLGRIVVNSDILKSRKHKVVTTLFLLFLLNLSLAQEARIKLEHVGYSKTMKEAYFVVSNVGDIPITDVTVYVDGKKVRTIKEALVREEVSVLNFFLKLVNT